ncbi:MAG: hypothetical protein P1V51_01440 [Deltaproteobacteria bacterium]|nr:hypothetical protein [Deltaproteobacteria bacterium]
MVLCSRRLGVSLLLAMTLALPLSASAAGGKKAKRPRTQAPKSLCAEAGRAYFQRLPPAPVWPRYEAMEVAFTEGKGGTCELRMVTTQKESLELMTYRATCTKGRAAYKCQGEGQSGTSWFQFSGQGEARRLIWHLSDPGLTLTGLGNRDATDRLRTYRGTITIELVISRDTQADGQS